MLFRDRRHAGQLLGRCVAAHVGDEPIVVLGLPRGGVPVAFEVAVVVEAPLDVLIVRKLGAPGRPELAVGAIAPGVTVIDEHIVAMLGVSREYLDVVTAREREELARRESAYRGSRDPLAVADRTAAIIDDGIATGSTIRAAAQCVARLGATRVLLAAPVCAAESARRLRRMGHELITVDEPEQFGAVGYWYDDFRQTSDAEVSALIDRSRTVGRLGR